MHSDENFHSRLSFLSIQMKLLENKIYKIFKKVSVPLLCVCCSFFHDFVEEEYQTKQMTNKLNRKVFRLTLVSHLAVTCSKFTILTQRQGLKYIQSQQKNIPERCHGCHSGVLLLTLNIFNTLL